MRKILDLDGRVLLGVLSVLGVLLSLSLGGPLLLRREVLDDGVHLVCVGELVENERVEVVPFEKAEIEVELFEENERSLKEIREVVGIFLQYKGNLREVKIAKIKIF